MDAFQREMSNILVSNDVAVGDNLLWKLGTHENTKQSFTNFKGMLRKYSFVIDQEDVVADGKNEETIWVEQIKPLIIQLDETDIETQATLDSSGLLYKYYGNLALNLAGS